MQKKIGGHDGVKRFPLGRKSAGTSAVAGRMRGSSARVADGGFGEAALRTHAVPVPEELEEAKTAFEDGSAVAKRTFN